MIDCNYLLILVSSQFIGIYYAVLSQHFPSHFLHRLRTHFVYTFIFDVGIVKNVGFKKKTNPLSRYLSLNS